MDYEAMEKMIKDRGLSVNQLQDDYDLGPGVVFTPPRQIGDWKEPYLVVKEKDDFFLCVRLSSHDELLAGTYDIIAENYLIEAWNALALPKDTQIKGYKELPEDMVEAVIRVRKAWMQGEPPDVNYTTGRDILSSPDRLLFHEAELQANESLQKAWTEGLEQFQTRILWERVAKKVDISDAFPELKMLSSPGSLSACIFPPQYLYFLWETDSQTPPPAASIRDTGNAWFTTTDWKELKKDKKWQFTAPIPERARSLVIKIGETENLLELLPSEQEVSATSPLSLVLFQAFEGGEFDPETQLGDALLEYRFSSLEKQALEKGRRLHSIFDQIGFFIAYGLCSEVISQITRLYLFQWVEEKLDHTKEIREGRTVFGKDILEKLRTLKESGFSLIEWFCRAVFQVWHKELLNWKDQINKSMFFEEEEIEEDVSKLLAGWESWQSKLTAMWEGLPDRVSDVLVDLVPGTSRLSVALMSYQHSRGGETDDSAPLKTEGLKKVEILKPDEWYGIFSHPENEDEDMESFLDELNRVRPGYNWGGLKLTTDGTTEFILDDDVVKSVPDISDSDIEPSAAKNNVLIIVGVCSDRQYLKTAIEKLKILMDHGQEPSQGEISEDQNPIIWINYIFRCNIPE